MRDWYISVAAHKLKARVLTDSGSDFVNVYTTPSVSFFQMTLRTSAEYSINDERVKLLHDYIREHENIERVLITDISDVTFQGNPFDLMTKKDTVYCGNLDGKWNGRGVDYQKFVECVGPTEATLFKGKQIYSMGIFGGHRDVVLKVLWRTWQSIEYCIKRGLYNVNLPAFNYALAVLQVPIVTGAPLHSRFKALDTNTTSYVRHQ
jgi:UDP-glucuronate 4-epimerase